MRERPLPFSPPFIGEEEIAEVVHTLRSGWITTGPKVKQFEQQFALAVNAPQALALNSGSAALHVALATLKIGRGDAVITSSMTFCSTVHAIENTGATPILVDVEPDTLNISTEEIQKALRAGGGGKRVKAILPVHLYGHACDQDALLKIASQHRLALVEDAAHALPAKFQGRMIGSHLASSQVRVFTCFSFYATKNLTTAEGGMLTGPPSLMKEARIWSLHGMSRDAWARSADEMSWYYEVDRAGFKYNMNDIQAAIGIQQLPKLQGLHTRRVQIAAQYNQAFRQFEQLQVPVERDDVEHAWHLYVLRLNLDLWDITRNQFIEELKQRNISSSVHFIPVHMLRYYREKYGYTPESFPVAYREYQRMVSLPLYPQMTDQDVQDVIEAVSEIAHKYARTSRPICA